MGSLEKWNHYHGSLGEMRRNHQRGGWEINYWEKGETFRDRVHPDGVRHKNGKAFSQRVLEPTEMVSVKVVPPPQQSNPRE